MTELIDNLRRQLARTRDAHAEPEVLTLDDLAERDPKLKARVDAVRAQLPAPPTREPASSEEER